jgi:hypothetical protein
MDACPSPTAGIPAVHREIEASQFMQRTGEDGGPLGTCGGAPTQSARRMTTKPANGRGDGASCPVPTRPGRHRGASPVAAGSMLRISARLGLSGCRQETRAPMQAYGPRFPLPQRLSTSRQGSSRFPGDVTVAERPVRSLSCLLDGRISRSSEEYRLNSRSQAGWLTWI